MNFSKNASKQQKGIVQQCVAYFVEKLLIFIHFYRFGQKHLLKQIQIFLRICPFSNMVIKTNFCFFLCLFLRQSLLCLKRKVLYNFSKDGLKKKEMFSLAVRGLLCGEKQFLLIFICFYRFNKKKLLQQIQIFFRIFPFSIMVRKTNFPSISLLISEIVTFMSKKKGSL